jgi:hypothetical protein
MLAGKDGLVSRGLPAALPPSACLLAALVLLTVGACLPGTATNCRADSPPGSRIDRPPERGPVFVAVFASVGGTMEYDPLRWGGGVNFIFRPLAAADFINFLYRWNTAMVLQAEYRSVSGDRDLLSADFILRRYEDDMRPVRGGGSSFWGLGVGATQATYIGDSTSAAPRGFSGLLEVGHEWNNEHGVLLFADFQFRFFNHGGLDYTGWSVHCGAGMPVSW